MEEPSGPGNVHILTGSNWSSFLAENRNIFVDFYGPQCDTCKVLFPQFEKASAGMLKKESNVAFAQVDVTVERAIAREFGIRHLPSLILIKGGIPFQYRNEEKTPLHLGWYGMMKFIESTMDKAEISKGNDEIAADEPDYAEAEFDLDDDVAEGDGKDDDLGEEF